MKTQQIVSGLLVGILLIPGWALAGLGSKKAQYVGGTATLEQGAEGYLGASGQKELVFRADNEEMLAVPYDSVLALAYGQHAGRRVGATIALSLTTMGFYSLPALFSKKRRHYLTVSYKNAEGKEEAVIFQLGKDVARSMLATLQARTGKKVEYEDEEARKAGNK